MAAASFFHDASFTGFTRRRTTSYARLLAARPAGGRFFAFFLARACGALTPVPVGTRAEQENRAEDEPREEAK